MAFIQVDIEALNLYPRIAMMTGFGDEHVHKGFNNVWLHCYRHKVDRMPLAFFKSFFPESQRLMEAVVICGFVEVSGDTVRIRGIEGRYDKDYSKRAESGRKGGQKTASKLDRDGGRFTKPSTVKTNQANQAKREEPTKQTKQGAWSPPEKPPEDVKPPRPVGQPSSEVITKQCEGPPSKPSKTDPEHQANQAPRQASAWSPHQANQADPKCLSPLRERETFGEGAPAQRESHAPPPEGAGRDSRTGTSEGTRGETPAVPESPAPAPRPPLPSPKPTPKPVPEYRPPPDPDPIESRSWLWEAHEMPRKAPPDDEWVNAVVWRLKRLTRVPDAIVRKSEWPGVQASVEQSYVVAAEEAAGMVPGIAGLVLLGELDDREQAIDGGFAADLIRWLRERAEHLEPMVERERLHVDQGAEEGELVH